MSRYIHALNNLSPAIEIRMYANLCYIEWFHGRCIGIAEKDVPDHYFCTNCKTTSLAVENEVEHSQVKKGKNASKSKVKNAKGIFQSIFIIEKEL